MHEMSDYFWDGLRISIRYKEALYAIFRFYVTENSVRAEPKSEKMPLKLQ